MSTSAIAVAEKRTSRPAKPRTPKTKSGTNKSATAAPRSAASKTNVKPPVRVDARVTKQQRILAMLSRHDGVTIAEIVSVTGWQEHSVRGFLAGAVRKKLGLELVSSKPEGQARRYRTEPKRGR